MRKTQASSLNGTTWSILIFLRSPSVLLSKYIIGKDESLVFHHRFKPLRNLWILPLNGLVCRWERNKHRLSVAWPNKCLALWNLLLYKYTNSRHCTFDRSHLSMTEIHRWERYRYLTHLSGIPERFLILVQSPSMISCNMVQETHFLNPEIPSTLHKTRWLLCSNLIPSFYPPKIYHSELTAPIKISSKVTNTDTSQSDCQRYITHPPFITYSQP